MSILLEEKQRAFADLRDIKANLAARGWFPATSGNLSVRVGGFEPECIHIRYHIKR